MIYKNGLYDLNYSSILTLSLELYNVTFKIIFTNSLQK